MDKQAAMLRLANRDTKVAQDASKKFQMRCAAVEKERDTCAYENRYLKSEMVKLQQQLKNLKGKHESQSQKLKRVQQKQIKPPKVEPAVTPVLLMTTPKVVVGASPHRESSRIPFPTNLSNSYLAMIS